MSKNRTLKSIVRTPLYRVSGRKTRPPRVGDLARAVAALPWGEEGGNAPEAVIEFTHDPRFDAIVEIDRISRTDFDAAEKALSRLLNRKDVAELLAGEERLFHWLEEDPQRPARFLTDPLGCLTEAGVKLSAQAREALARARAGQRSSAEATASNNEMRSLRVSLANPEKDNKRDDRRKG